MITFLTWFLGLTAGVQPVEVAVSADRPVARVELRLDSETVGERTTPPWTFRCDFGDLMPRRLEAVAFDDEDREIERIEQLVNAEVREASLALRLERDPEGQPVAVSPIWRSVEHPTYDSLKLTFDGSPLPFDSAERIELPAADLESIHFLTAEAVGPDRKTVTADIAYGGALGGEVSTRNTAVALQLDGRRRLSKPKHARGLLEVAGKPARVLAIERTKTDTVAVVEPSALEELRKLRGRGRSHGRWLDSDRTYLVHPVPDPTEVGYKVFRRWGPIPGGGGNISYRLPLLRDLGEPGALQVPEAVGVAGMQAASSALPRVVLLVAGPDTTSDGNFTPGEIRRYLEVLQVPLKVWYIEIEFPMLSPSAKQDELERREALVAAGQAPKDWDEPRRRRLTELRNQWGEVREIGNATDLGSAVRDLETALSAQRIIWIDGDHLPQEVGLAAGARGVRWAGTEPAP